MEHPVFAQASVTAIVIAVMALVLLVWAIFVFRYGFLWLRALLSGVPIMLVQLIGMSLRRVPPALIVDTCIQLRQAGLEPNVDLLHGFDTPLTSSW